MATRLHYALSSIEDSILMSLQNALAVRLPTARINTLMFDGVVLKIHIDEVGALKAILADVGQPFGVTFKVVKF